MRSRWVIPDFEPIAMIPSGRKLTVFHSNDVHHVRVEGPLLRAVVEQVERGEIAPNIDAVYALDQTIDAHRRMAANEASGKLVVLPRTVRCSDRCDRSRAQRACGRQRTPLRDRSPIAASHGSPAPSTNRPSDQPKAAANE
jgi:hypothetical protein